MDWDTLQSANGVHQTFSILSMPATSSQQAQAWFNTKLVIWWSGYKAKHHNFQKHLKHVYVRCWLHFFRVCLFFSLSSFSGRKTALFGTSDFHQCSNAKLFPIYQNFTFFLFGFASAKWISWKIYAKERTQKRRTIDARMHSTTTKTSSSNKWWWYIQNILVQQVEWFFFWEKNIRNESVMRFIIRIRLVDCVKAIISLCKEMHRVTMCICVSFNNRDTLSKINYKFIQIHCQTFHWNKRFNKPNWFRLLLFDG